MHLLFLVLEKDLMTDFSVTWHIFFNVIIRKVVYIYIGTTGKISIEPMKWACHLLHLLKTL